MESIKENVSALTKLVIMAFSDSDYKTPAGFYQASLNPESYSESYKSDFNAEDAPGSSASPLRYLRTQNEKMTFEFLFDRTGVLKDSLFAGRDLGTGVVADLLLFKNTVYNYKGNIHQPNYLVIVWGTLNFTCRLSEMNIDYKLFGPNGKPLRAVVSATFVACKPQKKIIADENKASPDLTHIRTVNAGDTLPLMTYRIYGDSKYYLEVAKVNKLSSFRKLEIGQQIIFPPIQKQS